MDMKQEVLKRDTRASQEPAIVPPVDIVEDENGITLNSSFLG